MENKYQYGFVFRQENCVGCQACSVACQIHNELPENVRFRKVDRYEVPKGDGMVDVWLPTHACIAATRPVSWCARPKPTPHVMMGW